MESSKITTLKSHLRYASAWRETIESDFRDFKNAKSEKHSGLGVRLQEEYRKAILAETALVLQLSKLVALDFELHRVTCQ